MDYNHVALFIKLVEAQSLSEASRRLNIPKSNLSRTLSSLEKQLGFQLIHRNTRHFKPTEVGLKLYQSCAGMILNMNNEIEKIKSSENELQGKFILSAPMDLAHTVVPKIVADFAQQYPKLQVELRGEDRIVDLVKEGVDVALRMGKLKDSTMKMLKISELSLILVSTQEYLKNHTKIKTPEQLTNHKFVSFNRKFEKSIKLSKQGLNSTFLKVNLNSSLLVNNPIMAKKVTLTGYGISLLPDFICYEQIQSQLLVRVLPDYSSELTSLHYVWPHQSTDATKVKAFINHSKEALRKCFV